MKKIKCGFSRRKITPQRPGIFMDGYGFRVTPYEGIHDDLYVNVCAMSDGEEKFLIFSFDMCGMNRKVYETIANQITAKTLLAPKNFALCCTHTHAGPGCGVLDLDPICWDYMNEIGIKAGEAASDALSNMREGSFYVDEIGSLKSSYNRRGRNVIDRRIFGAVFRDVENTVRGALVNASCHAVNNTSMLVGADYLQFLNETASDACPMLFLQGRCGDVDPSPKGETARKLLGEELCGALKSAMEEAPNCKGETDGFHTAFRRVTFPVKKEPPQEEIQAARQKLALDFLNAKNDVERHCIVAELNWWQDCAERSKEKTPNVLSAPLQFFAPCNEFLFLFASFELLTLTGEKLEKIARTHGFPAKHIFVVGYTNSVNSYLPPKEEFEFGGYEVSGASHWYKLPEYIPETETALLDWFEKNLPYLQ